MESSVNILLQTLKDNLSPSELTGLDKENYPCLYPESKQAKNNKGNRCWECMPCCYWALFIFFNQRCIDALVKSTRQSLDAIKRRMQAASKHSKESSDMDVKSPALFKVSVVLARMLGASKPPLLLSQSVVSCFLSSSETLPRFIFFHSYLITFVSFTVLLLVQLWVFSFFVGWMRQLDW